MKFNKLARELDFSVNQLADKVKDILPNANGGTEVSEEQKVQIITLLGAPTNSEALSFLLDESVDPILSLLAERIEEERQLETPEQIVEQMIERYLANPEDLPADAAYREAIVAYVELVKKRQARRQQQSSRLRSRLSKKENACLTVEPLTLENFYSNGPNGAASSSQLNGNAQSPQLAAASS